MVALAPDEDKRERPSQLALLKAHGIRPVKRRGQNFLLDGNLARAIAQDTVALGANVLELGAGGGALTTPLLAAGARVTAVEVDRNLCAVLQAEHGDNEAFTLVEGDLARLDWAAVVSAAGPRPVVAGNLPYVLTSTVLFALAELHDRVAGGVFMVQREVAERIVAVPGGRDFGVLAVVLGAVFRAEIVRSVPATVFWPQPDVESAIVRLVPTQPWTHEEFAAFTATVKTLFGQRRKKLGTLLKKHYDLDADAVAGLAARTGIDPEARPEQVATASWRRLAADLVRGEGA
jgi:16S rRNA (adenine1518-N6/adenine1519-N6)-dimethyltransferase